MKTKFSLMALTALLLASSASAQVVPSVLNGIYSLFRMSGSANSVYRYSVGSALIPDAKGNYAKNKRLKGRLARSIVQRGDRILNEKLRLDASIPVGLISSPGGASGETSPDGVFYVASFDEAMTLGLRLEFSRNGTNYASCDIPARRVTRARSNLLKVGYAMGISQKHKRDGTLSFRSSGGKCQALASAGASEVLPPYRKGDAVKISLLSDADSLFEDVLVVGTTKDKELVPAGSTN